MRVSFSRVGNRRFLRLIVAAAITACYAGSSDGQAPSDGQAAAARVLDADEIPTVLSRFEPLEVDQALAAFEVAPGYRIELVAAEPLVVDPVAYCFDPAGRMIVVEMVDYSERDDESLGRVVRLQDNDGDGQMDQSEVLVAGLSWPTAVASVPGGILVGAPPHLMFYPLADDDQGRAQVGVGQRWFTGFGRNNVQGMMNSLRWGNDLLLHGSTSSNGAELTGPSLDQPLRVSRQDFAIDPVDQRIRLTTGGAQHGMDFDSWGRKFGTSNSDHLQQMLMLPPVDGRSSRYSQVPPLRQSIADDGPAADVFRASPIEPWRLLRTHLRVTGQVPGVIEGGGRAAGYFTGATATYIYKGDQWPLDEGEEIVVVCDVGGNLVHRKRLSDNQLWKVGGRIDADTEFVRSTDTWFRPVQIGGGPDGAMYILDMYREVIEHPWSLPPVIKSQVDLNSGNDRGRIWRVVAEDQPIRRQTPRLDQMTPPQLVQQLAFPNHWQRRTAARLLVEQQAVAMIPSLRQLSLSADRPETRAESMHVLARLDGGLHPALLDAAVNDGHPQVRRLALSLMAGQQQSLSPEAVQRLQQDDSIETRFLLAYAAPTLIADPADRLAALSTIAAQNPSDRWIRWAVEGSLGQQAGDYLSEMTPMLQLCGPQDRLAWYQTVATQILASDHRPAIEKLVAFLQAEQTAASQPATAADPQAQRTPLLAAIVGQLASVRPQGNAAPLAQWIEAQLLPGVQQQVTDRSPQLAQAGDHLRLIRWAAAAPAREILGELLSPAFSSSVQQVAIQSLVANDAAAAELVVTRLPHVTPAVGEIALNQLASQLAGQRAIAAGITAGTVSVSGLSADVRRLLSDARDQPVRDVMAQHLAAATQVPAGELYRRYADALAAAADLEQGAKVFQRVCASCHAPPAGRELVGPELTTVSDQPAEQILLSILEPNREVNARYLRVQIVTLDGQVFSGITTAETEQSVVLVDSQGLAITIAREDIDELQVSNESLMPAELDKEITVEQMRDLIAYVRSLRAE